MLPTASEHPTPPAASPLVAPTPDGPSPGAPAPLAPVRAQLPVAENADKLLLVALGGSLVAFEQFFRNMRPDSSMAFVVIMHLSPTQPSELVAVLQHFTAMPVLAATDGLKVLPNKVHVIPPARDMSILHGTRLLFAPTQPAGPVALPAELSWLEFLLQAHQ